MKYILASFALMFAMTTVADDEGKPVESIRYKDGDIYTVKEGETVFITTEENLYIFKNYPKTAQFTRQWPTVRVDRPEPTPAPVGTVPGDQAWCESHVLFENGYTFKDSQWLRSCDTNKDRVYNICDWYEPTGAATFEEGNWRNTCNNGEAYDPNA